MKTKLIYLVLDSKDRCISYCATKKIAFSVLADCSCFDDDLHIVTRSLMF